MLWTRDDSESFSDREGASKLRLGCPARRHIAMLVWDDCWRWLVPRTCPPATVGGNSMPFYFECLLYTDVLLLWRTTGSTGTKDGHNLKPFFVELVANLGLAVRRKPL